MTIRARNLAVGCVKIRVALLAQDGLRRCGALFVPVMTTCNPAPAQTGYSVHFSAHQINQVVPIQTVRLLTYWITLRCAGSRMFASQPEYHGMSGSHGSSSFRFCPWREKVQFEDIMISSSVWEYAQIPSVTATPGVYESIRLLAATQEAGVGQCRVFGISCLPALVFPHRVKLHRSQIS